MFQEPETASAASAAAPSASATAVAAGFGVGADDGITFEVASAQEVREMLSRIPELCAMIDSANDLEVIARGARCIRQILRAREWGTDGRSLDHNGVEHDPIGEIVEHSGV